MKNYSWVLALLIINSAGAFNSLDLTKQIVTCSGESGSSYSLSNQSTAVDLVNNCKINHEESGNYALRKEVIVEFNATVTTAVRCEYHNNILDECKFVK